MDVLKKEVVAELEEVRAWYFTAILSTRTHMGRQLEIPPAFTKRTGWPGDSSCNLVTSIKTGNEWPIRFEQTTSSAGATAWVSVGAGYPKFLADNKVHLPVLLVFEMVDDCTLVVTIHHSDSSLAKPMLPPPKYEEERRHFQKTLKAWHTRPLKSTRLDLPIAYWRTMGDSEFWRQQFHGGGEDM